VWDRCRLTVHFPLEHDVGATLALACDVLSLPAPLESRQLLVPSTEWVDNVMSAYVPIRVAESPRDMWIVPEGTPPPVASAVNIVLQPGVAFGTGSSGRGGGVLAATCC
jgi:ribosomal protein L11 methyltransferase